MTKNNTNNKNEKKFNLASKSLKRDNNNDENLEDMPTEGACSAEFQQGCVSLDD
ncbi:MAG: hypothetical protein BWY74_00806 [Firmicutes bacterium ADurb.Bin419]|nr:MAG: hypothetical protein BWY74_00806 [Firmicutes bacterium ADurb.Bin419]